jgi:ATP-dependent exoDNAse (exonuclease V) alpha subunit
MRAVNADRKQTCAPANRPSAAFVRPTQKATHTVREGPRQVSFTTADIADANGRVKLAHAYSLTLFQAQGITTETALVLASPQFDRHSAYVASSRARSEIRFFVDTRQLDADLAESGLLVDDHDSVRLEYLAKQFARESIKTTTLDAINLLAADEQGRQREHIKRRELSHEL